MEKIVDAVTYISMPEKREGTCDECVAGGNIVLCKKLAEDCGALKIIWKMKDENSLIEDSQSSKESLATVDELRVICDATVRLVEIKQRSCENLCIENAAREIMRNLLAELVVHKRGYDGQTRNQEA